MLLGKCQYEIKRLFIIDIIDILNENVYNI